MLREIQHYSSQGSVDIHMLADFMLEFFTELQKDGQIDRTWKEK